MILINNGTNPFSCNGFILPKGKRMEVPEEIAKEFLKIDGVEKYIAPEELEKAAKTAKAEADAKVKALEAENDKLKAELEELKAKIVKTDVEAEADAKDTKKNKEK